jgi:Bacteriophage tail sheath protein
MAITFPNVPGVQINEVRLGAPPITGVGTSTAGFVGTAPKSGTFPNQAKLITSADQFRDIFIADATRSTSLSRAVLGFFMNGGTTCYVVNVDQATPTVAQINAGLTKLEPIDEIAIIGAPGQTDPAVWGALKDQAERTGDRFAILDPPPKVDDIVKLLPKPTPPSPPTGDNRPTDSVYTGFYYPRIMVGPDIVPATGTGDPPLEAVTPTGHIAGVYARVDANKGVHKAPANERIAGALGVEDILLDGQQESLNQDGVNVLRVFTEGIVIWGARTLLARNAPDKSFRYIPVRRLANYVEESLQEGLRFAVFEPNNLSLRQTITRSVRGFLDGVWRDGALFGATPDEAYYVRFPELFNRDEDRAQGKLTIEVGLRATFPAEFIIIRIGLILQSAATA